MPWPPAFVTARPSVTIMPAAARPVVLTNIVVTGFSTAFEDKQVDKCGSHKLS